MFLNLNVHFETKLGKNRKIINFKAITSHGSSLNEFGTITEIAYRWTTFFFIPRLSEDVKKTINEYNLNFKNNADTCRQCVCKIFQFFWLRTLYAFACSFFSFIYDAMLDIYYRCTCKNIKNDVWERRLFIRYSSHIQRNIYT